VSSAGARTHFLHAVCILGPSSHCIGLVGFATLEDGVGPKHSKSRYLSNIKKGGKPPFVFTVQCVTTRLTEFLSLLGLRLPNNAPRPSSALHVQMTWHVDDGDKRAEISGEQPDNLCVKRRDQLTIHHFALSMTPFRGRSRVTTQSCYTFGFLGVTRQP